MRGLAGWVSPEMTRTLGWTLMHFLWQGASVSACLAAILAFVRRSNKRYALSVSALVLMIAAPGVTFALLSKPAPVVSPGTAMQMHAATALVVGTWHRTATGFHSLREAMEPEKASPDVLLWLVQLWFVGVVLLSVRTAGGFVLLEHLRRREVKDVAENLRRRCIALQRRLRIDRAIRYCECLRLDAPAVIGWFRPVVLLPAMALTGLSEGQLEIVVAHELAHIRRFDSFVNLFQIVAETLLFYHPAVWWVNGRIRAERENCCDDLAVTTCGNAVDYARALAAMEEWRATPMLAMGANRGSLTARVARLLEVGALGSRARGSGFAAGLLCMAGALLAGNALLGYERAVSSPTTSSTQHLAVVHPVALEANHLSAKIQAKVRSTIGAVSAQMVHSAFVSVAGEAFAAAEASAQEQRNAASSAKTEETTNQRSFIDQMEAAGFKNLSADDLIALKVQGVTPDYLRAMRDLGFKVDVQQIVGMKSMGVTPEYVGTMRAAGLAADADQIIAMKAEGITPEYMRQMQVLGLKADVEELIGLKAQGISPEFIHQMSSLGLAANAEELIGLKAQGISAEYVKQMQALDLKPTTDDLIGMKAQGVTPEYIGEIRALGLEINGDDAVGLKAQGVTPEYVKVLQAAGLGKVSADDCVAAKAQGVTPEFIEKIRRHGFKDLDLEKLIALKEAGVF